MKRKGIQHPLLLSALAWGTGMVESLLVVRLVARLMAARPDNLFFQTLSILTDPLIGLLMMFDVGQPRFGSVFEISTMMLVLMIPIISYLVWLYLVSLDNIPPSPSTPTR